MKGSNVFMIALVLASFGSTAFAGPGGWGRMGPGYGMFPCAASNLELTPEQSQKIDNLREAYVQEATPLRDQLLAKRLELRLMENASNTAPEQITSKQKEILELRRALDAKATRHRLECRNVLTPDQQAKLPAFGPGPEWGYGSGRGMRGGW